MLSWTNTVSVTWEKRIKEGKTGAGEGEGRRAGEKGQVVSLWSSDALEQVGVAVGASAAVTQHSNARSSSHGTAVAYPTLGARVTC